MAVLVERKKAMTADSYIVYIEGYPFHLTPHQSRVFIHEVNSRMNVALSRRNGKPLSFNQESLILGLAMALAHMAVTPIALITDGRS